MSKQTIELQKKVADKVLYAIEGFDPPCIVAGGAPRDWTLGNPASDIDLFFFYRINAVEWEVRKLLERALGQEVSRLGAEEMTENYTTNPNIRRVWQSVVDGVTVQLIEMSIPTWKVVDSFPLTICKVWYKNGIITPTKEFEKSVEGSYIIKTDNMYANESRYLQKILAKFPDFKYYESYEDFFRKI